MIFLTGVLWYNELTTVQIVPIRAAFADREKNRKSLVSGGGSGGGGGGSNGGGGSGGGGDNGGGTGQSSYPLQFYFTLSWNSFFPNTKKLLKIHN